MKHLDLNIDNATLVEECRSGDRDAMSTLYTRFAPRMLHVISRYVYDRDSANDILHDGFIAAFTRLNSLRDPERIDFWLATIMKNLSLKYLQAQTITSLLDEIPDTIEEPDLDNILDFATLETLIRELPDGYQKVFRLAVLENKSHKEISDILGIAPNSSSSQLFHAKLRLRQLIKDYQLRAGLISIMLLLACAGILLFTHQSNWKPASNQLSADNIAEKTTSRQIQESMKDTEEDSSQPSVPAAAAKPISVHTVTIPSENSATVPSDTIEECRPIGNHDIQQKQATTHHTDNSNILYDHLFAEVPHPQTASKGWSAGISVDHGIMSFNKPNDGMLSDINNSQEPNRPPLDPDDNDKPSPSKIASGSSDIESYIKSPVRRHHMPISFSITAERHFSSWLSIETGIGYSYLHTDFESYNVNVKEVTTCHWHYLEFPLKANLYAYTSSIFKVYGSLGGRVAIPVHSYAQIPSNPTCRSGRFSSNTVWSVGASVGFAFRLSKRADLFIEPSILYHFPQDCTIPNIWTDNKPWSISIPLGFRLSW